MVSINSWQSPQQGLKGGQVALDEVLVCQRILAGWDTEDCLEWRTCDCGLERAGGEGFVRGV